MTSIKESGEARIGAEATIGPNRTDLRGFPRSDFEACPGNSPPNPARTRDGPATDPPSTRRPPAAGRT